MNRNLTPILAAALFAFDENGASRKHRPIRISEESIKIQEKKKSRRRMAKKSKRLSRR